MMHVGHNFNFFLFVFLFCSVASFIRLFAWETFETIFRLINCFDKKEARNTTARDANWERETIWFRKVKMMKKDEVIALMIISRFALMQSTKRNEWRARIRLTEKNGERAGRAVLHCIVSIWMHRAADSISLQRITIFVCGNYSCAAEFG